MDAIGLNAIWLYDHPLYRRTGIVMLAVAADDVSAKRSGDLCMAGVVGSVDDEFTQGWNWHSIRLKWLVTSIEQVECPHKVSPWKTLTLPMMAVVGGLAGVERGAAARAK